MNGSPNPNFDFYTFPTATAAPTPIFAEPAPQSEQTAKVSEAGEVVRPVVEPPRATSDESAQKRRLRRLMRRSHSRAGWGFTLMFLAWYTVSGALITLAPELFPAAWVESELFISLASTLPLYVVGIPLLCLLLAGLPRERVHKQRLRFGGSFAFYCIALTFLTLGAFLGNTVMAIAGEISGVDYANSLETLFSMPVFATLLLSCLLAPTFEELIFRKLLLERLLPFGKRSAVLLSALLFGLIHGNFYQFFYSVLLGILLACLYLRTGKLRACILLHALVNFTGGVLSMLVTGYLDLEKLSELSTDVTALVEYLLANPVGAALLLLYEFLMYGLGLVGLILLFTTKKKWKSLLDRKDRLPDMPHKTAPKLFNSGMIVALLASVLLFAAYFAA